MNILGWIGFILLIALLAVVIVYDSNVKAECEARGGVYFSSRGSQSICLSKDILK